MISIKPQTVKLSDGRISSLYLGLSMAGLLALSACASTPQPPAAELQAAEQAIATADQARITDSASPELKDARDKLAAARAAVDNKDMVAAKRLAEQSRVDAELATAKANEARARSVNRDIEKSNDALREELQRNSNQGIPQ